jgi:hypothetical protein
MTFQERPTNLTSQSYLNAIAAEGWHYTVSYNKWTGPLERTAHALPNLAWQAQGETHHAFVRHQPEGWSTPQPFAVNRRREGLFDTYGFIACDEQQTDAARAGERPHLKGEKEQLFSEVLSGLDLHRPPCLALRANQVYNLIAALDVPVVALVRQASNVVSVFEGTNSTDGVLQTKLSLGSNGQAVAWVRVPAGYYVLHAQMGVAAASTNLLNPALDVGGDGSEEWAFSGRFEAGMCLDQLADAFNAYLKSNSSSTGDVLVPVRVTGNANETVLLGGLQLYLERRPLEIVRPEILPSGALSLTIMDAWGGQFDVEASDTLAGWEKVGTVTITNTVSPFVDESAPLHRQRFYRVKRP